jgi:hypothetical protein
MILRGVIASYTNQGSGSVVVEGSAYPFTLQRMWQSPLEPRVGMPVDVTFSPEVGIASIVPVVSPSLPPVPPTFVRSGAATMAKPADIADLLAVLVVAFSWFALPAVMVNLFFLGQMQFTFWQILGHFVPLNSLQTMDSVSTAGMAMQIAAIASLFAALLPLVWRVRVARVGGFLPLLVQLAALVEVWREIHRVMSQAQGLFGEFSRSVAIEMGKQIHIGYGAGIAALAALWLAGNAVWKLLAARE